MDARYGLAGFLDGWQEHGDQRADGGHDRRQYHNCEASLPEGRLFVCGIIFIKYLLPYLRRFAAREFGCTTSLPRPCPSSNPD